MRTVQNEGTGKKSKGLMNTETMIHLQEECHTAGLFSRQHWLVPALIHPHGVTTDLLVTEPNGYFSTFIPSTHFGYYS